MKNNPDNHHRQSIRLKGYDYSRAGAYFITVCMQNRACLFGNVVDGKMILNNAGRMVQTVWDELPNRFYNIKLDEYVIMPNHIHGIISIVGAPLVGAQTTVGTRITAGDLTERAGTRPAPTGLGDIVGAFKSITTHEYIRDVKQHGWPPFADKLWQRNYYEHIVRNDDELKRIREYIINNPMQWGFDRENPDRGLKTTRSAQAPGPTEIREQFKPYGHVSGEGWMI